MCVSDEFFRERSEERERAVLYTVSHVVSELERNRTHTVPMALRLRRPPYSSEKTERVHSVHAPWGCTAYASLVELVRFPELSCDERSETVSLAYDALFNH